jgi:hypothetical protein
MKKTIVRIVGGVALLVGLVLGLRAWQHTRNWVGTTTHS